MQKNICSNQAFITCMVETAHEVNSGIFWQTSMPFYTYIIPESVLNAYRTSCRYIDVPGSCHSHDRRHSFGHKGRTTPCDGFAVELIFSTMTSAVPGERTKKLYELSPHKPASLPRRSIGTVKRLSKIIQGRRRPDIAIKDTPPSETRGDMTYITILPSYDRASTTLKRSLSTLERPSNISIICNHSTQPITLPVDLLTAHSRLFATLAHDPSTFSCANLQLNIDHDAFTVFARWLAGGKIHVPEGDEKGFATDLYLLMRVHAAGEALGAGTFADMVMDEIIEELTREKEDVWYEIDLDEQQSIDSDAHAKAHDLEILLQAAAAIWPPGSLGRDLLVDWYVHSPASKMHNLSVEAMIEIGDLDLAARCMVLGKERQIACDIGGDVLAPYQVDRCIYHEHRKLGLPCYKRSQKSVFSQLEFEVRCGLNGWKDKDDDDDDSGFEGDFFTTKGYADCIDGDMGVLGGEHMSGIGC